MNECTEASFLGDVSHHQMTIMRNDGLYRVLRFAKPGTVVSAFDLITWPGYLCCCGDMGTYVFRRLDDMFVFFRHPPTVTGGLYVNLGYWAEKCEAMDRVDGVEEYSAATFRRRVEDWLDEAGATSEARAAVAEQIMAFADEGEYEVRRLVEGFECEGFRFQDFWEVNLREFTYRFRWCCYAIAWGIRQYDACT